MDCVEVKQETPMEIGIEDIFDGNNDSDDTNDPFDNSSEESVCKYDSDSDNDPFKEDEENQPKNVEEEVEEIKNKAHEKSQETPTLNVKETLSTKATTLDFTILSNSKYSCNHCKFVTNSRRKVSLHIRGIHMKTLKSKKCPYCDIFSTKYGRNLKRHIIYKHEKENEKMNHIKNERMVNETSYTGKESCCDYDSDSDNDPFKVDEEYQPKNVEEQVEENKNKVHTKSKETLALSVKETLSTKRMHMNAPKSKQCPHCVYSTKYDYNLGRHIISKHKKKELRIRNQVINGATPLDFTILSNNKYSCNHCKFVTNSRDNVYSHIKRMHTNIITIKQCPHCAFSTKYGHYFKNHIISKHKKESKEMNNIKKETNATSDTLGENTNLSTNKYSCHQCKLVTNSKKYIYLHIKRMHMNRDMNALKINQCPYCSYKTQYDLTSHIISRHKTKSEVDCYECYQCGYQAKLKFGLRNHILTHKTVEENMDRMVKCNQCPKMFLKSRLRNHIGRVHEGDNRKLRASCHLCDYKNTDKIMVEQHIKRYHDNNENLETLRCEKCSFKTKFDFLLTKHIKYRHTKIFQCEKCPYQATMLQTLRLHTISHQRVKNESDLKYRCDKCDYKTYRHYSLKVHKLNHLKPEEIQYFYCYHCDFKAKRKDNLKTHVKNHFKKKNEFACYICDFKTNTKVSHIAHLGKHSREQNKKQNSKANHDDKEEKQKGQSSSKNKEKAPLKRRKFWKDDDDEPDKLDKNKTDPLKSLCDNKNTKKSDHTMTMRDRTKKKRKA